MYFELYFRPFIHGKVLRFIVLDLHRIVGRGGMSGMGGKEGRQSAGGASILQKKFIELFEILEWKILFFKTLLLFKFKYFHYIELFIFSAMNFFESLTNITEKIK